MEEFSEIQFKRVTVSPGETLIFRLPANAPREEMERLRKKIGELFPGIQSLVIRGDVDIFALKVE